MSMRAVRRTQGRTLAVMQVAMDYPKPDGTSTFTDYTEFMGDDGAYFDIGKESSNLFELPNLRDLRDFQKIIYSIIVVRASSSLESYSELEARTTQDWMFFLLEVPTIKVVARKIR